MFWQDGQTGLTNNISKHTSSQQSLQASPGQWNKISQANFVFDLTATYHNNQS